MLRALAGWSVKNVTTRRLTLEEYLNYDNGSDAQYELVAGELIAMPPESPYNSTIALYLLVEFLKFVPIRRLSHKDIEIVVSGARTTARLPDLMVLTEELAEALQGRRRGTITLDMPPPALVVEVVSPGKTNQDKPGTACAKGERDYRYKRSEYAARGILEYWIVDPEKAQVMVLTLVDGFYEEATFKGSKVIQSQVFPAWEMTVENLFKSGQ
ncbi:Uma2 family endonuclease [Scytonema sp. UIC 10036]|uniref:Uma2 family endonuclease n=1 Tax=Scytonema sp. UIC 10036 TaxID=2304196 RepID=UPI00138438C3|nr:Uma2 family endonuclease [Scytonema sp. UIC 10036]